MSRPLKLFVNYRRADNPHFVENIRTWLMIRYGRDNVFMDFDSLPNFAQFEDFIRQKIRESDVVISIIGPHWLDLLLDRAQHGDKDYVRLELEEALQHGKLIAPICILGAPIPPMQQLPASLKPIFDTWNAAILRDGKEVIEKIHPIMDDLERLLADRGLRFSVQSQPSALARDTSATAGGLDVFAAYGQMLTAAKSEQWDVAMGWIAELQNSGETLPPSIAADVAEIETVAQAKLADIAEAQRRAQVAAYLYSFIRARVAAGFVDDKTRRLLQEVWAIQPHYDPDDIGPQLLRRAAKSRTVSNWFFPPTPASLPSPFEWVYIPHTTVQLAAGGYVDADGLTVDVPPFFMARFCITNAQYLPFSAVGGYRMAHAPQPRRKALELPMADMASIGPLMLLQMKSRAIPKAPVVNVTWYEAMAFCDWLKETTHYDIALPTEAQWQAAAGGPSQTPYPWFGDAPLSPKLLHYGQSPDDGGPVNVDAFADGDYVNGLAQMAGNVWEWCLTGWQTGDETGDSDDADRCIRGGGWADDHAPFFRTTTRGQALAGGSSDDRGFRIVLNP